MVRILVMSNILPHPVDEFFITSPPSFLHTYTRVWFELDQAIELQKKKKNLVNFYVLLRHLKKSAIHRSMKRFRNKLAGTKRQFGNNVLLHNIATFGRSNNPPIQTQASRSYRKFLISGKFYHWGRKNQGPLLPSRFFPQVQRDFEVLTFLSKLHGALGIKNVHLLAL